MSTINQERKAQALNHLQRGLFSTKRELRPTQPHTKTSARNQKTQQSLDLFPVAISVIVTIVALFSVSSLEVDFVPIVIQLNRTIPLVGLIILSYALTARHGYINLASIAIMNICALLIALSNDNGSFMGTIALALLCGTGIGLIQGWVTRLIGKHVAYVNLAIFVLLLGIGETLVLSFIQGIRLVQNLEPLGDFLRLNLVQFGEIEARGQIAGISAGLVAFACNSSHFMASQHGFGWTYQP